MAKATCTVEGCTSPTLAREMCSMHYARMRTTGTTDARATQAPRVCDVEGCNHAHIARGWCRTHYARWKKHGDPHHEVELLPDTCSIEGCGKPRATREWCSAHYAKWRKYGDPLAQRYGLPTAPCKATDCDKPGNEGHGWCYLHYRRYWRHGDHTATSRIVGDDVARFESYLAEQPAPEHVAHLGPCWAWTGLLTRDGYGVMASDLPTSSAHRWSYRHHVADLIDGLELDHLCRVRRCVNPWHLDQVTHEENVRRAQEANRGQPADATPSRPAA